MKISNGVQIGGLQKLTLIDFPGRLAATVFLTGCNFRCPFCYSSELVLPEKIKRQPRIPQKELFKFLKERKKLIDGVVLCGGEPVISKGLIPLIKKIKKMGFLVKLDTNGSDPQMLKNLIEKKLIDYVAMDIKASLEPNFQFSISNFQTNPKSQISKYQKVVGAKVDLNKIRKSVEILKNSGIDFEFRTTVVPGIHTREDILGIAKWIGGPKVKYYLQNFRPEKTIDPKFEKIKPYSQEFLLEIQKSIAPFFETCQVR